VLGDTWSHVFIRRVVLSVFTVVVVVECDQIYLVSQDSADASETLAELRTLLGAVGNELKGGAKALVVVCEPLHQGYGLNGLEVLAGAFVLEVLRVLLVILREVLDNIGSSSRVLELVTGNLKVLPKDEGVDSTKVEAPQGILNSKAILASVLGNLIEEGGNQFLLLDELDIREDLSRELDGLVETVVPTI